MFLGRMLVFLIIIMMNLSFIEAATTNIPSRRDSGTFRTCPEFCRTKSCYTEGMGFRSIIDEEIDPCTDFYSFACGGFMKSTSISNDQSVINTFTIAQTKISTEAFLELASTIEPSDPSAFRKLKIYYQNCMNESRIEKEGTKPLFDILEKIGGFPVLLGNKWNESSYDWENSIYRIREQKYPVFFPIIVNVDVDNDDSTKYKIKIHSGFNTIDRSFLINGTNNDLLKAYYNFVIDTVIALGAKDEMQTREEMKKVLDFQVQLYNIKTPEEELINAPENGHQMTVAELSKKYPNIPWLPLLNNILNIGQVFIDNTEKVYIMDSKYISSIDKVINETPKRVIANYLAWNIAHVSLTYMPSKLRNLSSNFTNIIGGTKENMDRESLCLNEIMEIFPLSLSAMYVRKYYNNTNKDEILELFQNVKDQMRKNLREVDWMDNKTRKSAQEKLEAMGVSIGFAEELLDNQKLDDYYKELEVNPGNYLNSAFNVTAFIEKQNYKTLRTISSNSSWTENRNVALVNAYYILQRNIIEIPAGFLRAFYRTDLPQYINYGTIGSIIGHEIIHGFDNHGRQYDKKGNKKNWWDPETEKKFFRKAKCIIDQYNNFTVAAIGLKVNGVLTQGENIADNGGFKAAYQAYMEWTNKNNISEKCLPYMNYTPRQMFWISAATNWCSKERPEYLKEILSTDEHSPYDSRVILTFSNMREFAEDFECKIGTKMNPVNKCTIW